MFILFEGMFWDIRNKYVYLIVIFVWVFCLNCILMYINLWCCIICSFGVSEIVKVFLLNFILIYLNLNGNGIDNCGVEDFV